MQLTLRELDGVEPGDPVHPALTAPTVPTARGARDHGGPVTRGVCRMLDETGFASLTEFRLTNRRRVDVMALGPDGSVVIIEVKSTVEDFRGDGKWPDYLPYCEQFYFAVPRDFPVHILPDDCGLMVADGFGAVIRREPPMRKLNGTRKHHQLLRFAQIAGARLQALRDPRR